MLRIPDSRTLRERLETTDAVLVDVLPPQSFSEGHIPGAVSLPLAEIPWRDRGQRLEVVPRARRGGTGALPGARVARTSRSGRAWLEQVVRHRSIAQLLGIWLGMVVVLGVVYRIAALAGAPWLRIGSTPVGPSLQGLATAIYFSFVSALSIGYGDVVPLGPARVLAVIEGAAGLLLFGLVVSKLVSQRQEELVEETHRIAFEDRLGRVRTNLHLALSELHTIAEMRAEASESTPRSATRRRRAPTAPRPSSPASSRRSTTFCTVPGSSLTRGLEAILASIAACLEELAELLTCLPGGPGASGVLRHNLHQIARRSLDICGGCVPREYAADLRAWMDRIQALATDL